MYFYFHLFYLHLYYQEFKTMPKQEATKILALCILKLFIQKLDIYINILVNSDMVKKLNTANVICNYNVIFDIN